MDQGLHIFSTKRNRIFKCICGILRFFPFYLSEVCQTESHLGGAISGLGESIQWGPSHALKRLSAVSNAVSSKSPIDFSGSRFGSLVCNAWSEGTAWLEAPQQWQLLLKSRLWWDWLIQELLYRNRLMVHLSQEVDSAAVPVGRCGGHSRGSIYQ